MSKTTLDLSTLPDITDGTHTVKVKAKADGYRDSEFSNEVSYTKTPQSYKATFQGSYDAGNISGGAATSVYLNDKTLLFRGTAYSTTVEQWENGGWVVKARPYVIENVFNLSTPQNSVRKLKINGVEHTCDEFANTPYILTSDIEIQLGYYPD